MKKIIWSIIVLLAISGCAMNGLTPVKGWPELNVKEHYVSTATVRDECAPYAPWWSFGLIEACAIVNLWKLTCDIWFPNDPMPPEFVIEHERQHCRGYDHIGSSAFELYFKSWKAR